MKTIGILGGMGSYATADFFKRMIDAFPAEKEWDRPRLLIDNNCIMPSRVRAILYDEKVDELIAQMCQSVNNLSDCGADIIMLSCMTAHHFISYLPHQEKIINITELFRDAIKHEKKMLVLCTEGSIDAKIWDNALPDIELIYPNKDEMKEVRQFIEIVKTGKIQEHDKNIFAEFVNGLPCETVLLGCTELPILAKKVLINKRIYDPLESAIKYLKDYV